MITSECELLFQATQDGAWSADDIRANAQSWSLEGDAKLLDFMKNLSKVREIEFNRFFLFCETFVSIHLISFATFVRSENRRTWQSNDTPFTSDAIGFGQSASGTRQYNESIDVTTTFTICGESRVRR